jgi:8-oxo-dGTP pyrophosphatase MutT (NUDIX family)
MTLELPEILDLVNDFDVVVGQIPRDDSWDKVSRGGYVRVINAFVKNSKGQLFIPRRSSSKRVFPNGLDMGVGGLVQAGETYLEAFKRETLEELNLDVDALTWREIAYFSPVSTGLSAFMKVFEIQLEETPKFNTDDFSEFFWLTPLELKTRILSGDAAKDDLLELVERVYG